MFDSRNPAFNASGDINTAELSRAEELAQREIHLLHMDFQPGYSYSLDADFHKILAEAGGTKEGVEKAFLASPSVDELNTVNDRLDCEVTKMIPENPWYMAILMASLVSTTAAVLYLAP